MHILYIIGNGFDLAQGLQTSYKHFEKYYKGLPSTDKIIEQFKNEIDPKSDKWSDLELAIGKYTEKLKNPDDFIKIYYDLAAALEEYLKNQEELFQFDSKKISDYREHAAFPENFLQPADAATVSNYLQHILLEESKHNPMIYIDAINFNYTKTFDNMIAYGSSNVNTYKYHRMVMSGQMCHIHGHLSNLPLIFGVNDTEQISSVPFRTNDTMLNIFVKPHSNKVLRTNCDNEALKLIKQADCIVIYGSSLGPTDAFWWRAIYEKITMSSHFIPLILYHYTGQTHNPQRLALWLPEEIKQAKQQFLHTLVEYAGVDKNDSSFDTFTDRMFVGIDKPLFSFDTSKTEKK